MTTKPADEAMREAAEALRDKLALQRELSASDFSVTREDVMVRQILRALEASGWVCVPKVATDEMAAAIIGLSEVAGLLPNMKQAAMNRAQERLDAMLAAAPRLGVKGG